jgi:hypothetical protein
MRSLSYWTFWLHNGGKVRLLDAPGRSESIARKKLRRFLIEEGLVMGKFRLYGETSPVGNFSRMSLQDSRGNEFHYLVRVGKVRNSARNQKVSRCFFCKNSRGLSIK